MEFNSIAYIVFVLIALMLYYRAARDYGRQRLLIIVASAFFYAFWSSVFLLYLVGVLLVNYWASLHILNADSATKKRAVLTAAILFDLLNLVVFKYAGLAVDTSNGLMTLLGLDHLLLPRPTVFLPLAISFYTFSVVSYLVDVYRDPKGKAETVWDFLFYAMFFPHLIAGPILRKHEFFHQCAYQRFSRENIRNGIERILTGMFCKAVIADNLAMVVDHGYKNYATLSIGETYMVLVGYSFQIFFDFAGYSAIAIGSARLFGYIFPENFNIPYIATNISDFWRRWHMTLSRWIRDYIFIPLGGSRGSKLFANRNLLLTMGLAGLWHGASWNFAVWGLFHGIGLVVHHWYEDSKLRDALVRAIPIRMYTFAMIFITFHFVTLGWVLFRAPDFATAWTMINKFLTLSLPSASLSIDPAYVWKSYGFTAMALYGIYLALSKISSLRDAINRVTRRRIMFYAGVTYLIFLLAPLRTDPFIYFRF